MGLQLAGGVNVNTTFICVVGTRREIVDGLVAALATAGWSTVSGGGTGDVVMGSAVTPSLLSCRVRVYDSGANNCARLRWRSTDDLRSQTNDQYLLPGVGKVFRVIANRYQFFIFTPGASAGREFACGGVPYVPAFSGVIEAIWSASNGEADNSAVNSASFRNRLSSAAAGNTGTGFHCVNASFWTATDNNNLGNQGGTLKLVCPCSSLINASGSFTGIRWNNDAVMVTEPLIAWGRTSSLDEARICGQLWDAYIATFELGVDTVKVINGLNFHVITNNNQGVGLSFMKGTLLVRVP